MSAPHVSNSVSTDSGPPWNGRLWIDITELSQSKSTFTSRVLVEGTLANNNDWSIKHDGGKTIDRWISGAGGYYPDSRFDIDMAPHSSYRFISHTFTILHDPDGEKSVTFGVHYGQTGIPTFQPAGVEATLRLAKMDSGAWIRAGGTWLHGIPYVRHNGKWMQATAYVRSGGTWKVCG